MDIDCLETSFRSLANETRGVLLSLDDITRNKVSIHTATVTVSFVWLVLGLGLVG